MQVHRARTPMPAPLAHKAKSRAVSVAGLPTVNDIGFSMPKSPGQRLGVDQSPRRVTVRPDNLAHFQRISGLSVTGSPAVNRRPVSGSSARGVQACNRRECGTGPTGVRRRAGPGTCRVRHRSAG